MTQDINSTIQNIIALYNSGGNPQQIMQQMMQRTPQINQVQTQLQNMAQGRSPQEFLIQLARQNGVSEENIQGLSRILGGRK